MFTRFRLLSVCVVAAIAAYSTVRAGEPLPRSAPEAQGVSSAALLDFIQSVDREVDSFHGFVMVRHGQVIAEGWWSPYNAASRHELYSLSKSFTSTAVGIAVGEGKLSISDTLLSHFPDDAPANPSDQLKAMRIADLLRMSTGHQVEPAVMTSAHWAKAFLAQTVPFKPGTHFQYNTAATYMLSATVQQATGQTVLDYLRPRLFEPLGIDEPTWPTSPQGVSLGGYGLSVRTEDIAKFGLLYLNHGVWKGKQIVPAAWTEAATKLQTSNGSNPNSDWDQGYGYQFWRCRHNAFRGDGAFGQYCLVLPEQDTVIAINSGLGDMQKPLDLVWEKILPGIHAEALPADESAANALKARLTGLTLRLPAGSATPAVKVVGTTFKFDAGEGQALESIRLEAGEKAGELVVVTRVAGKEHRIAAGAGRWISGNGPVALLGMQPLSSRAAESPAADRPVAASAAWTDDHTLALRVAFYETPFVVDMKLSFPPEQAGETVVLDAATNVSFGPRGQGSRTGRAVK